MTLFFKKKKNVPTHDLYIYSSKFVKQESSAPLSRRGSIAQNNNGSIESPRMSIASLVEDRAPIQSSEISQRIRIGDYVRVRQTVVDPSYGWGAASHASVCYEKLY